VLDVSCDHLPSTSNQDTNSVVHPVVLVENHSAVQGAPLLGLEYHHAPATLDIFQASSAAFRR
jgi:hypothetical protein